MSIFKMRQYVEVDYRNLQALLVKRFPELKGTFPREQFSLVRHFGWSNDSKQDLEVEPLDERDEDASLFYSGAHDWAQYRSGDKARPPVDYLLSILAKEGEIPFGTLLVNVCW